MTLQLIANDVVFFVSGAASCMGLLLVAATRRERREEREEQMRELIRTSITREEPASEPQNPEWVCLGTTFYPSEMLSCPRCGKLDLHTLFEEKPEEKSMLATCTHGHQWAVKIFHA